MYGLETAPLTKKQEAEIAVAERRMLRWSLGWTRKDKVRNEMIRNLTAVDKISPGLKQERLKWFGHVKMRDEDYVGRRVLDIKVEGKRKVGRPKR